MKRIGRRSGKCLRGAAILLGLWFWGSAAQAQKIYQVSTSFSNIPAGYISGWWVACNDGDTMLGGGGHSQNSPGCLNLVQSYPNRPYGWFVEFANTCGDGQPFQVWGVCMSGASRDADEKREKPPAEPVSRPIEAIRKPKN